MTNKEKAVRFGKQMKYRVSTGMVTVQQARMLCDDFGISYAKQPRLQDNMTHWARREVSWDPAPHKAAVTAERAAWAAWAIEREAVHPSQDVWIAWQKAYDVVQATAK
jgi:hypothetical protein